MRKNTKKSGGFRVYSAGLEIAEYFSGLRVKIVMNDFKSEIQTAADAGIVLTELRIY